MVCRRGRNCAACARDWIAFAQPPIGARARTATTSQDVAFLRWNLPSGIKYCLTARVLVDGVLLGAHAPTRDSHAGGARPLRWRCAVDPALTRAAGLLSAQGPSTYISSTPATPSAALYVVVDASVDRYRHLQYRHDHLDDPEDL